MKRILPLLLALVVLFPAQQTFAQDADALFGAVDWQAGVVRARGIGAPPQGAESIAQARAMALRAAVTVARRNLLEVVRGVRIDSTTTVENFMAVSDVIVSRVEGMVRGSEVTKVEYFSDASVEAEIVMPMGEELRGLLLPLAGENIRAGRDGDAVVAGLMRRLEAQSHRLGQLEGRLAALDERLEDIERGAPSSRTGEVPDVDAPAPPAFTGLVVDARNTGFKPSLKPSLAGPDGPVYPTDGVDLETAVKKGYVRYFDSLSEAQLSETAGDLPLTVRAVGTDRDGGALLLAPEDAQTVARAGAGPQGFFARCRVVIVF